MYKNNLSIRFLVSEIWLNYVYGKLYLTEESLVQELYKTGYKDINVKTYTNIDVVI